jgi:hypothetical protein
MSSRSVMSSSTGRAAIAASLLAAAALAMPAPAMADRGGHRGHGYGYGHVHGHGGGHHWNGGPRIGVYVPAPVYRPHHYAPPRVYYAPPPVYHAPRVIHSAPLVYVPPVVYSARSYPPPVYVERNDLAAIPPAPAPVADTASWFFCADSNTYYPYVTQCATPWERVVPTPPSAGR